MGTVLRAVVVSTLGMSAELLPNFTLDVHFEGSPV